MTPKEIATKWVDTLDYPTDNVGDKNHQEYILELQKDIEDAIMEASKISSNAVLAVSVCPSCKGELIKFTTYGYDECLSCGKTYRQTDR